MPVISSLLHQFITTGEKKIKLNHLKWNLKVESLKASHWIRKQKADTLFSSLYRDLQHRNISLNKSPSQYGFLFSWSSYILEVGEWVQRLWNRVSFILFIKYTWGQGMHCFIFLSILLKHSQWWQEACILTSWYVRIWHWIWCYEF